MQTIVNNLITNYEVIQNNTANSDKILVILPGWLRNSSEWVEIAKNINNIHKIYILDFPGFGKTQKGNEDMDTFGYAEFVKAFFKKMKINSCIVLGHSFGGRIGIILASGSNIVEKLILVDSAGISVKSTAIKIKTILVKLFKHFLFFFSPKTQLKLRQMFGNNEYASNIEMKGVFRKVVNQDLKYLLPKITIPTLIIWGDKDKVLNVNEAKVYKNGIKNSKIRIVWGTGHSPHIEKQEKFLEIINEYLC